MEVYIGTILTFGFNFAPKGWSTCQGQLLSISQNTALYSLLSVTYGGNGTTNFALPNLNGRTMIGVGQGASGTNYVLGQAAGSETTNLLTANLPPHNHTLFAQGGAATVSTPAGNLPATASGTVDGEEQPVTVQVYAPKSSPVPMDIGAIGPTGGGQPVSIIPPYLACNVCIALTGLFPSRP